MSDTLPADPTAGVYTEQPAVDPQALSPADQEELDKLYAKLKPEATAEARAHVMVHTPPKWAVEMTALIDADFPPEPPVADPPVA